MKTEISKTDEPSLEAQSPLIKNFVQSDVIGSFGNPHTELEREEMLVCKGWNAAFNAWWKHKDENMDFRQMETKMCDALKAAWDEHLENYR